MKWSYEKLRPFRKFRHMALEEVGGFYWGEEDGSQPRVLVNMLELAVRIYTSILTPAKPKVMISSPFKRERRPVARALEFAVNQRILDSDLAGTLPLVTLDALFMMGIVAIGPVDDDVTQSFVDRVDPADWVHDARASELRGAAYMGHRYEMAKGVVLDWEDIPDKARDALEKEEGVSRPVGGDDADRTDSLTRNRGSMGPELEPTVELWDLYFPRTKRIETHWHGYPEGPIREFDFKGPKNPTGPYRFLRFGAMPSNIVPAPPMAVWFDAHVLQSEMYRKVARQAQMSKSGMAYRKGANEDADQVSAFGDGAVFGMDDPNSVVEKKVGEINPMVLNFAIHMGEMFSKGMGSLETLGGLGTQADTATQEKLINQSAFRVLSVYQREEERFLAGIFSDLAWYEWKNRHKKRSFYEYEPVMGISIPFVWPPDDPDKGKFKDYAFDVQPYSDTTDTPTGKANLLLQLWTNMITPMAGILAGAGIDIPKAAIKMVDDQAHLRGLPELKDLLVPAATADTEKREGGQPPVRQAPATTRTNVRVNRSEGRPGGDQEQLKQALATAIGRRGGAQQGG
jgi:hypothetical protein